ncbi:unnamed protein product [Aspergillus oryzae]|nr:unnamed protein product [Aspergillus oryzae]GMF85236.1 unnamed protein product [Aspergillus oryzae]
MAPGILVNGFHDSTTSSSPLPTRRRPYPHEGLRFDPKLKPKSYRMTGTSPDSKILFLDVNILDSTGNDPYRGDVLIHGERIVSVGLVPDVEALRHDPKVRVVQGRGRTFMSGLGDAHTHWTWNNIALELLGDIGVEEHTLITARSALCYLDSGYTMCYGAASAKDRLDCVVRDAINRGTLPGPRLLANGREIAKREGELAAGITAFAEGPLEMREVIRHHAKIGVDQIKLSMSGEAITETVSAEECFFTDEETAACVDEAHRNGIRVCSHARARDSVIQCARHGVDVIYHASYTDEEGMQMLEKVKDRVVVAPALNWLYATVYEAEPFGYSMEKAEQVGYRRELETAIKALKEMHKRGITVLPGGDYGFAWCPHGTYARDLEHFVKLLDFTPMESIVAATAGIAKLFMQEDELGKVLPGYYADCILVDGDPLKDIAVLQDHSKLDVIMINGRIHKAQPTEFLNTSAVPPSLQEKKSYFNFVAFEDELGRSRIGHLDLGDSTIQPLTMASGSPLASLSQVIELGDEGVVRAAEAPFPLNSVKLLPPLADRDVLCIGENYRKHIKEYRESGFAAADNKVTDSKRYFFLFEETMYERYQWYTGPQVPTVFTKRSTSITASGTDIYPHPGFTQTMDYEGELGVIIGKAGFSIKEKDAMDYIWGYTIINGKSLGRHGSCGPVAVEAAALSGEIRVQTHVNGEKRQDGTTADLIFSIPKLIETVSSGITLQPGDLSNRIADPGSKNPTIDRVLQKPSSIPTYNLDRTWGGIGLTKVGPDHYINVRELGSQSPDAETIVFIHGLGANLEYYAPLVQAAGLESNYRIVLYDLEGHGATPARASSTATLQTFARDLDLLFAAKSITSATLVGWSLGGLIAMFFAEKHPSRVTTLILLGPGPTPFPEPAVEVFTKRAALVREKGMEASGVANAVATAATSSVTKSRPLAISAVRQSLLSTHPEGYAKGCIALARSRGTVITVENLRMPTLIVAGQEDAISPVKLAQGYRSKIPNSQVELLKDVGHWHVFEDLEGTAEAIKRFLGRFRYDYRCCYEPPPRKRRLTTVAAGQTFSPPVTLPSPGPVPPSTALEPSSRRPAEEKSMEANAGVIFPQLLGLKLSPDHAPSMQHGSGWNLGVRRSPHRSEKSITWILSQAAWQKLFGVYVEKIHPVYGFLDLEVVAGQAGRRWEDPCASNEYDAVLCGVGALGSLFSSRSKASEQERHLIDCAKDILETTSTLVVSPGVHDVEGWLLRTMYLRCHSTPHAAWIASCTTMHIVEAAGLHRESTRGSLVYPEIYPGGQPENVECRRRLFWIAKLLNTWISFEYGRSQVVIRGAQCPAPAPKPGDPTSDLISLFQLSEKLDPDQTVQVLELEESLVRLEEFEFESDAVILSQSCRGLAASSRSIDASCPWWHVSNVPFQFTCILLAMDTRKSLVHVKDSLATLKKAADHFATQKARKAYKNIDFLVRLSQKRKEQDAALLNESVGSSQGKQDGPMAEEQLNGSVSPLEGAGTEDTWSADTLLNPMDQSSLNYSYDWDIFVRDALDFSTTFPRLAEQEY